MPDLNIRNVDAALIAKLKADAVLAGQTLRERCIALLAPATGMVGEPNRAQDENQCCPTPDFSEGRHEISGLRSSQKNPKNFPARKTVKETSVSVPDVVFEEIAAMERMHEGLTGATVSMAVEVPVEKLKAMYPKFREDLGKCPVCKSDLIAWGGNKRCVACQRNY